jgi:uncharacterized protein (DUF983 family)
MTTTRLLARGLARRCPVCGQGQLFRRWFVMVERCPRCGLRFERIDGHFTGALGLNTIAGVVAVCAALAIGAAATLPEIPVATLIAVVVTVGIIVPLVGYPFSKTLWTAIDLRMRPLEPGEVRPEYEEPAGAP